MGEHHLKATAQEEARLEQAEKHRRTPLDGAIWEILLIRRG